MVFQFGTVEITVTVEKIQDDNNAVGTWLERRESKYDSSISFMDLYVRFRNARLYANYNQEFHINYTK